MYADGEDEAGGTNLATYMAQFMSLLVRLRRYYKLLLVLLLAAFIGAFIAIYVLQPKYTAVAVVGPSNGTLDDLSSSGGGGLGGLLSGGGGGLKRLAGLSAGLLGGGKNVFDQYTELLTSNLLAAKLAQDQNVLRSMFYKNYDWDKHEWKRHDGVVGTLVGFVKGLLHYPVKPHPDQDDVAKYLAKNVNVDAPLTSSFITVSLIGKDPKEAEWLLNTLLYDADSIIRENKHQDVAARIAYLVATLPEVTASDQKDSLIGLLSDQQQSMMTIEADKRFASALVDAPHADLVPTSPSVPVVFGLMVLLALAVWGCLVYFLPEGHWLLERFTRPWKWLFWEGRSHAYAQDRI